MEEYEIEADYTTARYKSIKAVLKTLLEIEIIDLAGKIEIWQSGKKLASIDILEKKVTK